MTRIDNKIIELAPFNTIDAQQLISWIPSEEFGFQWGALVYNWPLTETQIQTRQKLPEVESLVLVMDGVKVGFIEVLTVSEYEVRLCRIIISEHAGRGLGLGKELIRLTCSHIKTTRKKVTTISLAVFEHNQLAHKCYVSAGFCAVNREPYSRDFQGQNWPLIQMEMTV